MGNAVLAGGGLLAGIMPVLLAETADFDCERLRDGFWSQPVNGVTSLAFVVAGVAIVAGEGTDRPKRLVFGALVAATGAGSVVQHGPNPPWADLAHDLPLAALIAYVAVDAIADVAGRRLPAGWWLAPTAALVPIVLAAPRVADATQALMAAVAIGASLVRLRRRPEVRATILTSMALLGVGALIGTLSRSGWPLCRPDGLLQGHGVWHVLASAALWRLTPAIGRVGRPEVSRSR